MFGVLVGGSGRRGIGFLTVSYHTLYRHLPISADSGLRMHC